MSAIEPSPSSMTHAHTVSGRGDDSIKPLPSSQSVRDDDVGPKRRIFGVARWTLGIFLLMVTVVMWTASSFLGSYIFADNTYSKPYFVTFANTTVFAVSLIPMVAQRLRNDRRETLWLRFKGIWQDRGSWSGKSSRNGDQSPLMDDAENIDSAQDLASSHSLLMEDGPPNFQSRDEGGDDDDRRRPGRKEGQLSFRETVKLSLEFCALWFAANYFAAACLEYTTVASATILSSTSSIWTLLLGSLMGVEKFSIRKLIGVLSSLAGIVLISSVDLSGSTDENRGSFPHKTTKELAIGDAMAFFGAIIYGFYTVIMKKRIGDESRVDVLLFFGLVGLCNVLFLWPGFPILHFTRVEPFEMPPSRRVWLVIISNSLTSFISDLCWAFAMLLTTPLVVTVGLGLTIPLSLVGQMVLESQYSSAAYWIGAAIVLASFIFINYETGKADDDDDGSADKFVPDIADGEVLDASELSSIGALSSPSPPLSSSSSPPRSPSRFPTNRFAPAKTAREDTRQARRLSPTTTSTTNSG